MNNRKAYASKTQELFYKINDYTSFMGLLNLWGENVAQRRLPAISKNSCYILFYYLINSFVYVLLSLQITAIYNRKKFDSKRTFDWVIFTSANSLIYSFYLVVTYYKNKIKELLLCLVVHLKTVYNDQKIERQMIKRAKAYMCAYFLLCSLSVALYGCDSLIHVLRSGKPFTTVITVWPDDEDKRNLAVGVKIALYLVWWVLVFRSSTAYVLAIATTICLNYQFRNLQSYFRRLRAIFHKEDLSHTKKEEKYEKLFKVGIKLHSDTLWCTRQCQHVFGLGYSGQIMISITGLAILMLQFVNLERTIVNVLSIFTTACTVLVTTGIFMWNAGDVTVQASDLATAMYCSGWENCERACAARVRKLVVVAMAQAQKPIVIRGFGGIMKLSYGSYLSIVKFSYSVFSLVY